ncbi:MAG TPA: hypothetical protein VG434_02300 [Sphingomicrobium sp.]|nr:hypothetical protein [Sphingomicrobium sp.]
METDSVRAMGDSTLVDLWIEGRFRAITVSREAIASFLKLTPERAEAFTDADRVEFVRTHLATVVRAAGVQLRLNPGAESILIDGRQLSGEVARPTGDRRKGERRKRNIGPPGGVERRRS